MLDRAIAQRLAETGARIPVVHLQMNTYFIGIRKATCFLRGK